MLISDTNSKAIKCLYRKMISHDTHTHYYVLTSLLHKKKKQRKKCSQMEAQQPIHLGEYDVIVSYAACCSVAFTNLYYLKWTRQTLWLRYFATGPWVNTQFGISISLSLLPVMHSLIWLVFLETFWEKPLCQSQIKRKQTLLFAQLDGFTLEVKRFSSVKASVTNFLFHV